MIKLIIFDLHGTLAYSDRKTDLGGFFGKLSEFGISIKNEREAQYLFDSFPSFFSSANSWLEFAETVAQKFDVILAKESKEKLAEYLKKKLSFKLYEDAEAITDLPQKKAVLTLASRFLVDGIPEMKNFDIFTVREIRYEKPDPEAFRAVLRKMKALPEETMMVGDNLENDILPALKLGMKAVLIDREGKVSDNSIVKIKSLKELKGLL